MKITSSELKSVFIGTLLGDSCIVKVNTKDSFSYKFSCEQVNMELIRLKKHYLDIATMSDVKIYERLRNPGIIHKNLIQSIPKKTFSVIKQGMYFKKLYKAFYGTGSKQVTISTLGKLTPIGIAMWIMDDGYTIHHWFKKPNGKIARDRTLRICTDSFDNFSIKQIVQYFSEAFNIKCVPFKHKTSNASTECWRIKFPAKDTQKLISIIYKYFVPSMLYKIDLEYSEDTLMSNRCLPEYVNAAKYISQHIPSKEEDIVYQSVKAG